MDIRKLQRAIVDGLEDVKAQDIQVFNTEHLSPLFERVIVASGTTNRQTKALAASVRDAVETAGMHEPRIEGEDNGEWIIVDCGAAVAHIMQPAIRQYYHLEEIWGDKPVRHEAGRAPSRRGSSRPASAEPARRGGKAARDAAQDAPSRARRRRREGRAPSAGRRSAGARGRSAAPRPAAAKTAAGRRARRPHRRRQVGARRPPAKSAPAAPAAQARPPRRRAAKRERRQEGRAQAAR